MQATDRLTGTLWEIVVFTAAAAAGTDTDRVAPSRAGSTSGGGDSIFEAESAEGRRQCRSIRSAAAVVAATVAVSTWSSEHRRRSSPEPTTTTTTNVAPRARARVPDMSRKPGPAAHYYCPSDADFVAKTPQRRPPAADPCRRHRHRRSDQVRARFHSVQITTRTAIRAWAPPLPSPTFVERSVRLCVFRRYCT